MASRRTLDAGKATITLSLNDKVSEELKLFQAKLKKIGSSMQQIGAVGLGMASSIGAPFLVAIKYASDAQETLSKFKAVFGEQAAAADSFANTLAKTVGRSAIDIRKGMSAFQAFFVGLGFNADKARQMSEQMHALSIDFASFHNISDEDSMGRFISALSGSSEVLDQFGINIKVAALEQELLNMGIHKGWNEVTEMEKATARMNVIMRSMGDQGAIGDAVRTADSFSNRMKALKADITDLATQIGTAVLPVASDFISKAREATAVFGEWAKKNPELVASLGTVTAELAAVSAGAVALGSVMTILAAHPVVLGIAGITAGVVALDVAIKEMNKSFGTSVKTLDVLFPQLKALQLLSDVGGDMVSRVGGRPAGEAAPFVNSNPSAPFVATPSVSRPMSVPNVATPSIDPMQGQLARLGLNGIEQNTSDPSGRAGAALLVTAWDAAMKKARESLTDVAETADTFLDPWIESAQQRIDAAMKNAGEVAGASQPSKAIATLDAAFARQQFGAGGKSGEVQTLERMERQNDRILQMLGDNLSRIGWIRGG